jgi:predicted nuclease of predicted toxin-antitoxin system
VKFIVDNQVPVALCHFINAKGADCRHVLEAGLARTQDHLIWQQAIATDRVIVSKDEDFFFLASLPGSEGRLVWVRLGNCRKSILLREFERRWPQVIASLEAGERVVEIR